MTGDGQFWDRIAERYARNPVGDPGGWERTLSAIIARLTPETLVLEAGCGTGSTALRLAPHCARITATDISAQMIAIARRKAEEAGVTQIGFEQAPAGDPRHDGAGFDMVLALNLLHLLPDLPGALAHFHAALKPGGLMISKTAAIGEMNPLVRLAIPLMRLIGKAPQTVLVLTGEEIERAIRAAGFEIVETARHGTKGRDVRPYVVARRPLEASTP